VLSSLKRGRNERRLYEPAWLRWLWWVGFIAFMPLLAYGLLADNPPHWIGLVAIACALTALVIGQMRSYYRRRWQRQSPRP
jgi:polyferredoxin